MRIRWSAARIDPATAFSHHLRTLATTPEHIVPDRKVAINQTDDLTVSIASPVP